MVTLPRQSTNPNMATMIPLFSSIGDHIPIFKREKLLEPLSEGYISRFDDVEKCHNHCLCVRLHYRGTCLLIMAMMMMVTCPEWISGKESFIDCMHGGSIPDEVINSYCWISGTFSVPRHYRDFDTQVGCDWLTQNNTKI